MVKNRNAHNGRIIRPKPAHLKMSFNIPTRIVKVRETPSCINVANYDIDDADAYLNHYKDINALKRSLRRIGYTI